MIHHKLPLILGLAAGLTLLGCEREREQAGEMAEEPFEGIREPEPSSIEADLDAAGESGITGRVVLTPRDDQIAVELTLEGADAERYVAHVHRGECGNDLGMVTPIGELTVSEGRNRISGTIDKTSLDPMENYFVQAHRADGTAVACANLPQGELDRLLGEETPTVEAKTQSPDETQARAKGETY